MALVPGSKLGPYEIRGAFIWLLGSILFLAAELSGGAPRQADPPRIGIVQSPDEFDGYGCMLQLPSDYENRTDRVVVMINSEEEAVMNIDGSDVRLYRVGFDAGGAEKGIHSVDRYRTGDITVDIEFTVTKRCIPNDETCDLTEFAAAISIMRGAAKGMVSARGVCGG
jgi:hypothetical protein